MYPNDPPSHQPRPPQSPNHEVVDVQVEEAEEDGEDFGEEEAARRELVLMNRLRRARISRAEAANEQAGQLYKRQIKSEQERYAV